MTAFRFQSTTNFYSSSLLFLATLHSPIFSFSFWSLQQVNMPYVMIPAFQHSAQTDSQMSPLMQQIPCKPGEYIMISEKKKKSHETDSKNTGTISGFHPVVGLRLVLMNTQAKMWVWVSIWAICTLIKKSYKIYVNWKYIYFITRLLFLQIFVLTDKMIKVYITNILEKVFAFFNALCAT